MKRLVVLAGLLAGCEYRLIEDQPGVAVFKLALSTIAWCIGVPLVGIAAGALLAALRQPRVLGFAIAGPFAFFAATILPGIVMDTVTIDGRGVHQTVGFWFARHTKGFDFAEVEKIVLTRELKQFEDENSRQLAQALDAEVVHLWMVHYKDHRVVQLDPGDLWDAAEVPIVERCRQAGVIVEP